MKKFFSLLALLAPLALLAQSPQQKGLQIARDVDAANNGFKGEYAEMEMVLINAHGDKTTRKLLNESIESEGDGDRSVSTFQWPADVKGTRMLTWSHKTGDDDQWLYLPSLKRVKRIASQNKSGAFMGSEFSYEDLGSQEVEEFTYKFLEDTSYENRPCWKIERVPVSPRSGYSKEITWMDKEYMNPVRIEYYDRKGELLKVGVFSKYVKYGKFWRANRIDMDNVQTKKRSELTWTTRELNKSFPDSRFASDSLEN